MAHSIDEEDFVDEQQRLRDEVQRLRDEQQRLRDEHEKVTAGGSSRCSAQARKRAGSR